MKNTFIEERASYEAQIEKMKLCGNCRHSSTTSLDTPEVCVVNGNYCCDIGYPNWEMKE